VVADIVERAKQGERSTVKLTKRSKFILGKRKRDEEGRRRKREK